MLGFLEKYGSDQAFSAPKHFGFLFLLGWAPIGKIIGGSLAQSKTGRANFRTAKKFWQKGKPKQDEKILQKQRKAGGVSGDRAGDGGGPAGRAMAGRRAPGGVFGR